MCVTTKIGSAMAAKSAPGAGSSGTNNIYRQYISGPLDAQTITGTVKGQAKASETANSNNLRSQIVIRVVSNDGTTVRGTLKAADTGALSSEWALTPINRKFPLAAISPVTVDGIGAITQGDRLCIEIGSRQTSTQSASPPGIIFGDDSATDLGENETDTSTENPWIEFSYDFAFEPVIPEPVIAGDEPVEGTLLSSISSTWNIPTTDGETLLAVISIDSDNPASEPTITPVSSDWGSPVFDIWNDADCKLQVYCIEDSLSRSGTEVFNITDPVEAGQDANLILLKLAEGMSFLHSTEDQGADSSAGMVAPTITTTAVDQVLLYVASHEGPHGGLTGPLNSFIQLNAATTPSASAGHERNAQFVAYKAAPTATTYDGADYSSTNVNEWAAGLLAFGLLETTLANPSGDVANADLWTTDGGSSTNIYTAIDEDTPSDTDYIKSAAS